MKRVTILSFLLVSAMACNKSSDTVTFPLQYPSLPAYVQPADNATFPNSSTVTFEWKACSDPQGDPVVYDLLVEGYNTYSYTDLTTTRQDISFSQWEGNNISWQVTTRDNHGNYTKGPVKWFILLN
jgi:hypothetical protein